MIAGRALEGHILLLVGETRGHLGQSALLHEVFNRTDGDAPAVDLETEKRNGDFIRNNAEWITACVDLSDGGLALAGFEMAISGHVGITLDATDTAGYFGEDQARYLISTNFDRAEALMVAAGQAGVPLATIGHVGGDTVTFGTSQAPLAELADIWRGAFGEYFN
jgi:phosphoribosylformylglycinamidine synthase